MVMKLFPSSFEYHSHLSKSRSLKNLWNCLCYAKSLQSCPTLCDPVDGSHQAPPSLGFSRQEHWSGLPFPSPMQESESEVAQSCPTLRRDPMDCSLPGSSIHGIFQARVLEWGAIVWDEGNCAVVWAFFGIAFLWDWNENWPFPVLWPLLSFPNLLTYWVQYFHNIIF